MAVLTNACYVCDRDSLSAMVFVQLIQIAPWRQSTHWTKASSLPQQGVSGHGGQDASSLQEEVAKGLRMVFKQSGTDNGPCRLTGAH